MREKPFVYDPDERVFTFQDVKRLYIRCRKLLIRFAIMGAVCVTSITALRAPKYKVEATFKEGLEKKGGSGILDEFLGSTGGSQQQSQMIAIMKSFQVMKPLVEQLGLQASIPQPKGFISKIVARIRENFRIERGIPIEDLESFTFRNVIYKGEKETNLALRFIGENNFEVFSSDKKTKLAQGVFGEEIHLSELQFTLFKVPETIKMGIFYEMKICPWIPVVKRVRDLLQIKSQSSNRSIYDLLVVHRDRLFAVELLNELMNQYQLYLKREHDQISQEQLTYLEQKQDRLFKLLDGTFEEYSSYLSRNLENHGFLDLTDESLVLLTPHHEMLSKLISIDVELKGLDRMEKGAPILDEGPFSKKANKIFEDLRDLKQQRDLLELSLQYQHSFTEEEGRLEVRRGELREIRNKRETVQKLIESIDHDTDLPISSLDLNRTLTLWAERVQNSNEPEEREDLAEYLENYFRLLSVREKMLQERFLFGNDAPQELEGIDLISARALFVEYNNKLDQSEALMRHYDQLKRETKESDFAIGSLSSVLTDPLSQKLIEDAVEIAVKLKDEKHHSSKEGERWEEELDLQRKILSDHLDQLFKIEELKAGLVREKIFGLRQVSLDCINRQISVLNEQIVDYLKERRCSLLQEKEVLKEKVAEIRVSAADLPEKWRLKKWLDLKSALGVKMIEAVSQAVESKAISHRLHHVESKPLDFAVLPDLPQKPGLYKMGFIGAILFGFGAFFVLLLRSIIKGFPVSPDQLQALHFPFLGEISRYCDGPNLDALKGSDLELLRQMGLFLEQKKEKKVIGLITGQGPDYSYALAENLFRISYKSIIVRCDFGSKFREEDLPGLLQIWKGEISELPIRKEKGFDRITTGGYTPYGTEVLQSGSFAKLVEILKQNYDWVFLLLKCPLTTSESIAALRLCEKAIVTVAGEQTQQLTPFANWAYIDGHCRLTFIARS